MPENKEVRKLELCDIAPYLPYGLKISLSRLSYPKSRIDTDLTTSTLDKIGSYIYDIKPYMRPLDQLTQEITHGQETFIMMDRLFELEWPSKPRKNSPYYYNDVPNFINVHHHNSAANTKILKNQMFNNPYWMIRELLKYHFDIFGLIPSGLAIPIHNTK